MQEVQLTANAISRMLTEQGNQNVITVQALQVSVAPQLADYNRVIISDGQYYQVSIADKSLVSKHGIQKNSIFDIVKFKITKKNKDFIEITEVANVRSASKQIGEKLSDISQINNNAGVFPAGIQSEIQNKKEDLLLTSDRALKSKNQYAENQFLKSVPDRKQKQMMQQSNEIAIQSINPHIIIDWFFIGKVHSKSQVRTGKNSKGPWKVFECEILDKHGDFITGTFFNDSCDKFDNLIQAGNTYRFCQCLVRPVNQKFKKNDHEYSLQITVRSMITQIEETAGEVLSELHGMKFKDFQHLETYEEKAPVDIIAVVTSCSPVMTKLSKNQQEFKMRKLTLRDHCNIEIELTLFGEAAVNPQLEQLEQNQFVVAFGKLYKDSFAGGVVLKSGWNETGILVNPKEDERYPAVKFLNEWWQKEGKSKEQEEIKKISKVNEEMKIQKLDSLIQLDEKYKFFDPSNPPSVQYFEVPAIVKWVQCNEKAPIAYPSCPNEFCKKKLEKISSDSWSCSKCEKQFPQPLWRYLITLLISDFSTDFWVQCFDPIATEILGRNAAEVMESKLNEQENWQRYLKKALGQERVFILKAYLQEIEGRNFPKFTVTRIHNKSASYLTEVDIASELEKLLV